MTRDFSFSDICLPIDMTIDDAMVRILSESYPELRFTSCYDYDSLDIKFAISDKTTWEILKRFKFDEWGFRHHSDETNKAFDEIVKWCENYYNPKPEPIVEKVEVIVKPHHCECCGAPIPKGTTRCEYCGTEYY